MKTVCIFSKLQKSLNCEKLYTCIIDIFVVISFIWIVHHNNVYINEVARGCYSQKLVNTLSLNRMQFLAITSNVVGIKHKQINASVLAIVKHPKEPVRVSPFRRLESHVE